MSQVTPEMPLAEITELVSAIADNIEKVILGKRSADRNDARRRVLRRPYLAGGCARRREDDAGEDASPPRSDVRTSDCNSRPTCCRRISPASPSSISRPGNSALWKGRSLPISCWRTRSTAPRRKRRRPCSNVWRSGRSPWRAAPALLPEPVFRARHAEPHRVRRHLPAAGIAVGPFHDLPEPGLSGARAGTPGRGATKPLQSAGRVAPGHHAGGFDAHAADLARGACQ